MALSRVRMGMIESGGVVSVRDLYTFVRMFINAGLTGMVPVHLLLLSEYPDAVYHDPIGLRNADAH